MGDLIEQVLEEGSELSVSRRPIAPRMGRNGLVQMAPSDRELMPIKQPREVIMRFSER
jgi:hypothetical protein